MCRLATPAQVGNGSGPFEIGMNWTTPDEIAAQKHSPARVFPSQLVNAITERSAKGGKVSDPGNVHIY